MAKATWTRLERLDLSKTLLTPEAVSDLSKCQLPKLLELNLRSNQIGTMGVSELVRSDWPLLERLWLGDNKGVDAAAVQKMLGPSWTKLKLSWMLEPCDI